MAIELINSNNNTALQNNESFSNIDAEIALIGCILIDNRNYEKVSDFLTEEHFVDQNNQLIYKTIKNLLENNTLVSPITLKNYLPVENNDVEIVKYLNLIKDSTPSSQNAYNYAKIIYDLFVKRNLVTIGHNIISETANKESNLDGETLIEKAENDLYLLSQTGNLDRKYIDFNTALKSAVDIISEAYKRD